LIFIEYDPHLSGAAWPDGQALERALSIAEWAKTIDADIHETYSTENIFYALRLLIANGTLPHDRILFVYQGHAFQANEYGAIRDWPEGFSDLTTRFSENIIRAAMQKRKDKIHGSQAG